MKKKRKKFKLFDIQTGLVLERNEETRWTKKHSEICEIVALGESVRLKLIKTSNEYSLKY